MRKKRQRSPLPSEFPPYPSVIKEFEGNSDRSMTRTAAAKLARSQKDGAADFLIKRKNLPRF